MAKYIVIPESWRRKNYAFEFLEVINNAVEKDMIDEINSAEFIN